MLICTRAPCNKKSWGGFGAATKQLLLYPMTSIQTRTLHTRGWQYRSPKFSPLMYSQTLCLYINSACFWHLSHCEGLLLTLTRCFSVLAVPLKSLFLTDMTGQLVLLNNKFPIMQTCFSLLLVWIFTFLLLSSPSACRSFLPSVFSTLDFLPRLWFQDASVVCLPLFLQNWKLFFF